MVHLAPKCKELHGVDISDEMVRRAEASLAAARNVHLHLSNGYDLPLNSETFDSLTLAACSSICPRTCSLFSA